MRGIYKLKHSLSNVLVSLGLPMEFQLMHNKKGKGKGAELRFIMPLGRSVHHTAVCHK